MSQHYADELMKITTASLLQNLGWNSATNLSIDTLTDVFERYIQTICKNVKLYTEFGSRTESNLDDVLASFCEMGISLPELEEYITDVEAHSLPRDIVRASAKKQNTLKFPSDADFKTSVEVEMGVEPWMPAVEGVKGLQGPSSASSSAAAEKRVAEESRPATPAQLKRHKSILEESSGGRSDMQHVMMSPLGLVVTQGQGQMPSSMLPPIVVKKTKPKKRSAASIGDEGESPPKRSADSRPWAQSGSETDEEWRKEEKKAKKKKKAKVSEKREKLLHKLDSKRKEELKRKKERKLRAKREEKLKKELKKKKEQKYKAKLQEKLKKKLKKEKTKAKSAAGAVCPEPGIISKQKLISSMRPGRAADAKPTAKKKRAGGKTKKIKKSERLVKPEPSPAQLDIDSPTDFHEQEDVEMSMNSSPKPHRTFEASPSPELDASPKHVSPPRSASPQRSPSPIARSPSPEAMSPQIDMSSPVEHTDPASEDEVDAHAEALKHSPRDTSPGEDYTPPREVDPEPRGLVPTLRLRFDKMPSDDELSEEREKKRKKKKKKDKHKEKRKNREECSVSPARESEVPVPPIRLTLGGRNPVVARDSDSESDVYEDVSRRRKKKKRSRDPETDVSHASTAGIGLKLVIKPLPERNSTSPSPPRRKQLFQPLSPDDESSGSDDTIPFAGTPRSSPGYAVPSPSPPRLSSHKKAPQKSKKSKKAAAKKVAIETKTIDIIQENVQDDKSWMCPTCHGGDDGRQMIGCDLCDQWYHWSCVGVTQEPTDPQWYCPSCKKKSASNSKKRKKSKR